MAKYKVLELSFIHDCLIEAGEIVEYDGIPGANLELVERLEEPSAQPPPILPPIKTPS